MNTYTLYEGDCFKVFSQIPDNSINLIITDPPYNILKFEDININGRKAIRNIDFDQDKLDIKKLCREIFRVLIDGGSFYIFMSDRQIGEYINELQSEKLIYSNTLVWYQKSGFPSVRKRAYQSHCQYIAYGHKEVENSDYVFNFKSSPEMRNLLEFEGCVSFEYDGGSPGEYLGHPTQKPSKLISHLMEISSNKDDTVLDPFLGSGTTMFAAQNLRRNCIGIELDNKYVDMAMKRCFHRSFLDRKVKYNLFRTKTIICAEEEKK